MADNERPAISLEYVKVEITADVTLDDQPIEMALVASGSPGDDDWIEAEWVGGAGTTRQARILAGPGDDADFTPSVASYYVWWNLTDNPEIPARCAGYIRFT